MSSIAAVAFSNTARAKPAEHRRLIAAAGLSVAIMLAAISVGGLATPAYALETANWTTQALAQDWFDLVIAAPFMAVSAWRASRGSRLAMLVLAGGLLFAAYTAVIYAFGVHLNAFFLLYCAALGVAGYSLVGLCAVLSRARSELTVPLTVPRRLIGGFLVGIGVAFSLLWLAQLIPAAISGTPPPELVETGLFTNPVHVLDLSFILPLHLIAGLALWQRRPVGYLLAPVVLMFSALMAASIATLSALLGNLTLVVAMGAVSLVSTVLLVSLIRSLRAWGLR